MVVMPFTWSVEPASNLVVIAGGFRKILDFWASREKMESGFCEGYKHMFDRIDIYLPMTNLAGYHDPKKYLQDVFIAKKNWKSNLGYSTPKMAFERDPIAIPAAIFALIICGLRPGVYSFIFISIVLLLLATVGCLINKSHESSLCVAKEV